MRGRQAALYVALNHLATGTIVIGRPRNHWRQGARAVFWWRSPALENGGVMRSARATHGWRIRVG